MALGATMEENGTAMNGQELILSLTKVGLPLCPDDNVS